MAKRDAAGEIILSDFVSRNGGDLFTSTVADRLWSFDRISKQRWRGAMCLLDRSVYRRVLAAVVAAALSSLSAAIRKSFELIGGVRHRMAILPAVVLLGLVPGGQALAKWPDKPVRIVLPFGAGGVADFTLRLMADKLGAKLGQRFVIDNMPGPGGINAVLNVLGAPADGYTMGLVVQGTAISVATFKKLPFEPLTQFEMVSTVGVFDMHFAVKADSPYAKLEDFITAAKERPGELNIGTIPAGFAQSLGAELFKSMAGINVQIVPYKNSPDIVVALLRNDVQMLIEFPPAIQGQVEDKKLRVLATSAARRRAFDPDMPTVAECVKGYEVTSWNGVFAPKGTPKEVIDTMNGAMSEVLAMPDVKESFAKVGVIAMSSTPNQLMDRLTSEIKKWDAVMVAAGIPKK
jgi:tripartite-type tricarboxylate transporter receptor subunit TctC